MQIFCLDEVLFRACDFFISHIFQPYFLYNIFYPLLLPHFLCGKRVEDGKIIANALM